MAENSSEERNLPPSQKKLRDARKKGQVAKSKDMPAGAALAGGLATLMASSGAIMAACIAMLNEASNVSTEDFGKAVAALLPLLRTAAFTALAPILLIVPVAAIVAAIVMLKGVPFSIEPIAPKADHLNPAEGFKRLFGMKSWVELAKSLLKTILIVCTFVFLTAAGLDELLQSPACGIGCEIGVMGHLAKPLMIAAILLFLVAGGADIGLQNWLFLRDQKMGVTELKRERKDMEGDPHFKRERNRLMKEAMRLAGGLGLKRATVMIHDGSSLAVGLRYKINEMPAPVLVCRARQDRGRAMMAEAIAAGLPMAEDAELAMGLASLPLGHGIPERFFRNVALALRRAGTV